jgi:hypothetical protein
MAPEKKDGPAYSSCHLLLSIYEDDIFLSFEDHLKFFDLIFFTNFLSVTIQGDWMVSIGKVTGSLLHSNFTIDVRNTTTPSPATTTTPAGGSTTTPAGGSTTTPAGGSTTTPAGGSTTTPAATTTAGEAGLSLSWSLCACLLVYKVLQ